LKDGQAREEPVLIQFGLAAWRGAGWQHDSGTGHHHSSLTATSRGRASDTDDEKHMISAGSDRSIRAAHAGTAVLELALADGATFWHTPRRLRQDTLTVDRNRAMT